MADEQDKTTKLRDFIYKLVLLIVGFALTTVAGGLLTNIYKRASAAKEAELATMQSDFAKSMAAFEEISTLMDRRIFRMRQLHDILDGTTDESAWSSRYQSYRDVFLDWNENLNRNLAITRFYFHPADDETTSAGCGESFQAIQNGFIAAQKLMPQTPGVPNIDAAALKDALDTLSYCIFSFDNLMLDRIAAKQQAYLARIKD